LSVKPKISVQIDKFISTAEKISRHQFHGFFYVGIFTVLFVLFKVIKKRETEKEKTRNNGYLRISFEIIIMPKRKVFSKKF
jgi:hypothetical protein